MNSLLEPLILASGSPRRRALLSSLGVSFEVVPPDLDEVLEPVDPREAVRRLALRKARAVAEGRSTGTVLAGDTVVEVGGEVLGKPRSEAEAHRYLGLLSDSVHCVHTGVALLHLPSGREVSGVETTRVRMRRIQEDERRAYVASGEPFGKAGAYAVQETGDRFVTELEGPYDNVVGLPMDLVRHLLAALGSGLEP